jgi:molybdopterin synthase catalytic subunit
MTVKICSAPFDPWLEIQAYQNELPELLGRFGATALFVGTMRDFNEGDSIHGMLLEHYPGMTERQLENIAAQARQQWQVLATLVVHRVGELWPNDPIVVVAVWSSHRGDAFDACRYITEALKTRAPFWKKELLADTSMRWVSKNTDGYRADKTL